MPEFSSGTGGEVRGHTHGFGIPRVAVRKGGGRACAWQELARAAMLAALQPVGLGRGWRRKEPALGPIH